MKPIAKFLLSAADPAHFPAEGPPEVAFLGRSNVGKSSLLNSLAGVKVAHVSSTPGRTQTINFFGIHMKPNQTEPEMLFVDLPGYGYARVPKELAGQWWKFIDPYLKERESLALCVALVDISVPPQESDKKLLQFLQSAGRNYMVVGTKSDRLSGNKLRSALRELEQELGSAIFPYSTKTGDRRALLWNAIRESVANAPE